MMEYIPKNIYLNEIEVNTHLLLNNLFLNS